MGKNENQFQAALRKHFFLSEEHKAQKSIDELNVEITSLRNEKKVLEKLLNNHACVLKTHSNNENNCNEDCSPENLTTFGN